jgi:predicted TIM-barrel fold metal-dependent hydrolase
MAKPWAVSSDSHISEPPDLWTSRVGPELAERVPHVVSEEQGDWWHADSHRLFTVAAGTPGARFEGKDRARTEARAGNYYPGAHIPSAKIEDMDADGVYGELVYPTLGIVLFRLPDRALLSTVCRIYNDWIAEFCNAFPVRLKGVAMINLDDVEEGAAELERAAKLGLKGAMISVYPDESVSYDMPIHDRFWAAAQDLDMPLSLHVGTNRNVPPTGRPPGDPTIARFHAMPTPAYYTNAAHWVEMSLANMVFGGVFERFPGLATVSLEHEAAWAPHFLNLMDYTYTQRPQGKDWIRFKDGALPSDSFRRNIFISYQEDPLVGQLRSIIGVDNLLWGSDYPHGEGTFPRSRQILDGILEGVPELERDKMVRTNTSRLYSFDLRD